MQDARMSEDGENTPNEKLHGEALGRSATRVVPVVLAGGSGSRLWPMSREQYPKQLLGITSPVSLLQSTVERLRDFDAGGALSGYAARHLWRRPSFLDGQAAKCEWRACVDYRGTLATWYCRRTDARRCGGMCRDR